jgi:hypothetical protein
MNKFHFQILFAAGFGAILTGIVWILISPDTPLPQYLQPSAGLRDALALIHIVPFVVEYVLSGNPHGGSDTIGWIATFVQWTLVGFLLAFVWSLIRRAKRL